jgi:hypothetical protein
VATPIQLPDSRALIASLSSDFCPICQGHKQPNQTMCRRDYHRLPAAIKRALYDRIGEGYEQAVERAMLALHTTVFHLPPSIANRKEH